MDKKILYIGIFVIFILILTGLVAFAFTTEVDENIEKWDAIKNKVNERDVDDEIPTFSNFNVDVYYTSDIKDFKNKWCSPVKTDCFKDILEIQQHYENNDDVKKCLSIYGNNYCCIPEEDRGFYEEVMCKGEGKGSISNGPEKIYTKELIGAKPSESRSLSREFIDGYTKKESNPEIKRTAAINPRASLDCYIDYWQKIYVYFGRNNPANGVYLVEDEISEQNALDGECKISLFAGVGKNQLNSNFASSLKDLNPKIYLLDDDGNILADRTRKGGIITTSSVVGTYHTNYGGSVVQDDVGPLLEKTYEFAKNAVNICSTKNTFAEKQTCVKDEAKKFKHNDYELNFGCVDSTATGNEEKEYYEELKTIATKLADCSTTELGECMCDIPINKMFSYLNFERNEISFGDFNEEDTVKIDIDIYEQSPTDFIEIMPLNEVEFFDIDVENKIQLKKQGDGIFIYVFDNHEPTLQACVPEQNHFLMCAESPNSNEEPLRFTLKI